ncbi:MAG: hypothetical protein IPP27_06625 [Bacteroidetes bacterium]|nr:hypothetical protein [Bacteroidota bacterium]
MKLLEEAQNHRLHEYELAYMEEFKKHHYSGEPNVRNDMFQIYKHLVLPLHQVFTDFKMYDNYLILSECNLAFENYKKAIQYSINRFVNYRKSYHEAFDILKDIVVKLTKFEAARKKRWTYVYPSFMKI